MIVMFYRLDSTRITLKEYWWGMPNPLVVLGWATKWLRIRLPGSVDDPPVESLEPFRVEFTDLPRDACAEFAPLDEDLRACGFHSPECYWIRDTPRQTDIYQAVYLHESGKAFARVQYRVWNQPKPAKQYRSVTFLSRFRDGSWLASTSAKPDMLAPPTCRVVRSVGAPVEGLWASHQRELEQEQFAKTLVPVRDERELAEAVEAQHAAVRDFHVRRGVFVPMDEDEQ